MYTKEQIEELLSKKLDGIKEFYSPDGTDFEALNLAFDWAGRNGYTVGSLQRDEPVGIAKGAEYVSKWRNLGQDKVRLDGAIICDGAGTRNARTITIYFQKTEDKKAAYTINSSL